MAEIKTKQTDADVTEFINTFVDKDQKKKDSFELLKIMQDFTGYEPKMWGPTMIGFGSYHYKSARSAQEGDWPIVGFSPRKAAFSLYVYMATPEHDVLLGDLGKYTMGKGCIYFKKLSDINIETLEKMMRVTLDLLDEKE